MDIKSAHEDYLSIIPMNAPLRVKRMMLQALFSQWSGAWRVVGVTQSALQRFKEHDFKRKSGMGINRSHLIGRSETFDRMLAEPMEVTAWWEFYYERDRTVLATSSENMSTQTFKHFRIDDPNLFRTKGYAWNHGEAEEQKLRELHKVMLRGLEQK